MTRGGFPYLAAENCKPVMVEDETAIMALVRPALA
jgi:hypothetical protein